MFKTQFSKVGAYVQQDDVLIDVLTPRELLCFAVKIRLGVWEQDRLEMVVDSVIKRLNLEECAD